MKRTRRKIPLYTMEEICKMNGVEYDTTHSSNDVKFNNDKNINNIIEYNGYQALIEYSAEDATLFGKVLDIDDKVIFEIDNPKDAIAVFKEVINDYMAIKGE